MEQLKNDNIESIDEIEQFFIKSMNKARKRKLWNNIVIAIMPIYIIFIFIYLYLPTNLKENFDLAITKITPYTDTCTIDMLKSDWVRMRSGSDY